MCKSKPFVGWFLPKKWSAIKTLVYVLHPNVTDTAALAQTIMEV